MCAGSNAGEWDEYRAAAEQLGRTLVERRIALVHGGARVLLMGALADSVLSRNGDVTGIMPESASRCRAAGARGTSSSRS